MTSTAPTIVAITIVFSSGIGFVAGYLLGRGPNWVLWENRGTNVRATTEFFNTRSGCVKPRDIRNTREEASRQEAWAKWRGRTGADSSVQIGYVNPNGQRLPWFQIG